MRRVLQRQLPISAAFLATLAYFHAVGLHPQYMRAESGRFLATAARGAGAMGGLLAGFFTHSYNGHYTPIAFGLELLQSAIFGPHEWIWLTRQALVFAVLGVALFRLMRATLPVPIAFAATVVFMAQPLMLEIASWPFMVMQLGYLIFFAVTASLLIEFARQPKATTLWWTVSCGYATMQVCGTGLATAFSLEGCLIGLYLAARSRGALTILRRHLVWAIGVLAVLTLIHGALMAHLPPNTPATVRVAPLVDFERFGGLLVDTLWAALRAMWGADAFPWPRVEAVTADAAYGFGVVAILVAVGFHLAKRYRHDGTPDRLAQILVYSFSAGTLLFVVALMVMRGGSDDELLGFLIGSRYLILISAPTLVVFASLVMVVKWPAGLARAISAAVIVTSLSATFVFAYSVKPKVWPRQSISDDRVIAASTAYIETAVATHSPVEDVDMSPVGDGFPFDLKWYAPIIRKQIGLAPSVDLTWGTSTNPTMTRARNAVLDALR